MITRRSLILALGSGVMATPFASFAQQAGKAPTLALAPAPGKIWRVGFLADNARPASIDAHFHGAFARGLRDLGYIEGKNLFIEWRYAENRPELLPALAAELVRLNVDVIVTQGSLPTLAAQTATSTIPIMFVGPGDPVGAGLVKSLARPGGNITGLSSIAGDLSPKRLELLLAMTATVTPKVSRVAMLVNPRAPVSIRLFDITRIAGEKLGVAVQRMDASTPQEIDNAFTAMLRDKAGALMVPLNPFYEQQKDQLGELSIKRRVPCMAADRMYAEGGCLMTYGTSLAEMFRQAATYVDKILKGARPGDLPVESPTRLELVINGKTAKALGLAIPKELLLQANRVIE